MLKAHDFNPWIRKSSADALFPVYTCRRFPYVITVWCSDRVLRAGERPREWWEVEIRRITRIWNAHHSAVEVIETFPSREEAAAAAIEACLLYEREHS